MKAKLRKDDGCVQPVRLERRSVEEVRSAREAKDRPSRPRPDLNSSGTSRSGAPPEPRQPQVVLDPFEKVITEMIEFFSLYYKRSNIRSSKKLDLIEVLLTDLTSKSKHVHFSNLPAVTKQLDNVWILHFEIYFGLFDVLYDIDEKKNLKGAIDFVTKFEKKMTTVFPSRPLPFKLTCLRLKCNNQIAKLNSLKAFHSASEIRENAMSSKTSVDRQKSGYQALSLLEKAEKFLSSCLGLNQKLLGQIYSEKGLVYMDLLEDLDAAEEKFLEAVKVLCLESLTFEAHKWLRQIALLRSQRANRKPSLEEVLLQIKTKREAGTISLIEFVLKNHPPKHVSTFNPKDWESPIQKVDKKTLIKLVTFYHTDRVDRSKFGEDYFLIVEDIAKCFGEALARIKDGL
jgi:tetratricopeptide (TPR) repeat protein